MAFRIAAAEGFLRDLPRAPKNVQNATFRSIDLLRNHPNQGDGDKLKQLRGYKDLWRCRVSDSFRLIYRLGRTETPPTVTLLMLGDRKEIYERLGTDDQGRPGSRIILDAHVPLETEPTAEELAGAFEAALIGRDEDSAGDPDTPLPVILTPELLSSWGIPAQYHTLLSTARTEGELLGLADRVPDQVLEHVMNGLWPRPIEDIAQQPIRIVESEAQLQEAAEGSRTLSSFLLNLDEEQHAFVGRFGRDQAQGPWLLKGGPGSGKSVVALYCIRELLKREAGKLPGQRSRLKILLTSYTNSLVNASSRLLKDLLQDTDAAALETSTVSSLATCHIPQEFRGLGAVNDWNWGGPAKAALEDAKRSNPSFGFSEQDLSFLRDEVDWVIAGQTLSDPESYLSADRGGRGRGLTASQRRQVWDFYELFRRELRKGRLCLWSEIYAAAQTHAQPQFDYVFVDEVQDLTPAALGLCVRTCKGGSNVFVTADSNQSIYGTGMRWSTVAEQLRFTGRAAILKRNYRTTCEIWAAVSQMAPQSSTTDRETLDVKAVYHGVPPGIAWYSTPADWAPRLNRFLFDSLVHERVGPDSAAVLCPTQREMEIVAAGLDPRLNPKIMRSKDLDIAHPGVKITTMHAAKGLEFPVAAVVGVEEGRLPRSHEGEEAAENLARDQRLLFVACTRAMRRLLVLASAPRRSRFLDAVTDDLWEFETL